MLNRSAPRWKARFAAFLFTTAVCSAAAHAQAPEVTDPDARAAAIIDSMTEEERFALLRSFMPLPFGEIPEEVRDQPAMAAYIPPIERLGIPAIRMTDASLGVTNPMQQRKGDVATAMPSGLALAATFNPALAYQAGRTIGVEARAKGFNVLLGGGVNLARDPRNGRNFEYLGEDPLLAGTLAGEAVRGTQAEGVVSTVKHFAVNDQETLRNTANSVIAEPALRMSDLLAFELAIERGQPGSVMCAYNRVNGPWACGSDTLLNQVLKQEWGYKGWVISDWGAVHAADYAAKGLDHQAGAQLDEQVWFDEPLRNLVASGEVSQDRIKDMSRRILRSLYAVGADRPMPPAGIDYDAHGDVALKAAEQGTVVLKNEGLLPIAGQAKKILVVGGYAPLGVMSGGGSSQVTPVGGPAAMVPVGGEGFLEAFGSMLIVPSSPLKALREALPDAQIAFDSGYFPAATAARADDYDLVIVFATQWQIEALDAGSMTLPMGQDRLIEAVAAANPRTAVVLETGNPVRMPWRDKVGAIVEAWYPGQRGGEAIANVLTGAVNPSGHLPISFPVDESQLPRPEIPGLGEPAGTRVDIDYDIEGADVGYRWYAREGLQPAYPFGHGLSYTTFAHEGLEIVPGDTLTARFTVRNTGQRAGADVAQVYLTDAAGKPLRRLAGFARVELAPGEAKQVEVPLEWRVVADWVNGGWQVAPGSYRFMLAENALAEGPAVTLDLQPRRLAP
ncbi:beta-glucosidase family protein [Altericroceibacterium xinjiangense]|uniref:beta-glucosidase family protein n=1 Tax=Altericroceibacterium xinjiangense TaxID=762261 RepID=UPI000F7E5FF0|nr:glycoside hydrolase family 3 C-terminal domain-containing protein [Altericroceibacterium xinjiangense]